MPGYYRKLTREELVALAGEELPERVAMSLLNANLGIPIDATVAPQAVSAGSGAYAETMPADVDRAAQRVAARPR